MLELMLLGSLFDNSCIDSQLIKMRSPLYLKLGLLYTPFNDSWNSRYKITLFFKGKQRRVLKQLFKYNFRILSPSYLSSLILSSYLANIKLKLPSNLITTCVLNFWQPYVCNFKNVPFEFCSRWENSI